MKTIKYLLVAIFFLLFANMASAVPMWFDADGTSSNTYTPTRMDEMSGEVMGIYDTYQYLGPDGVLGNGDSFDHTDPLQLYIDKLNLLGVPQETYTPPYAELYANMTGIGGTISDYDGGTSGPTDLLNPGNIIDDTYTLSYTPYLGQIDFYYDLDADMNETNASLIGSFKIVRGGGDILKKDNSTLTSDIGLDLIATTLNPGYFFLDNGGAKGQDASEWMNEGSNNFLISLVDNSVNLTGFSADATKDAIVMSTEDNGTDVEFGPVPEPATMILFGIGLLGLSAVSRKKFIN